MATTIAVRTFDVVREQQGTSTAAIPTVGILLVGRLTFQAGQPQPPAPPRPEPPRSRREWWNRRG